MTADLESWHLTSCSTQSAAPHGQSVLWQHQQHRHWLRATTTTNHNELFPPPNDTCMLHTHIMSNVRLLQFFILPSMVCVCVRCDLVTRISYYRKSLRMTAPLTVVSLRISIAINNVIYRYWKLPGNVQYKLLQLDWQTPRRWKGGKLPLHYDKGLLDSGKMPEITALSYNDVIEGWNSKWQKFSSIFNSPDIKVWHISLSRPTPTFKSRTKFRQNHTIQTKLNTLCCANCKVTSRIKLSNRKGEKYVESGVCASWTMMQVDRSEMTCK